MRLDTFLSKYGLSPADFAKRIGVSRTSVVRYVNKTRRPDWPVLERIKLETNGLVTPEDFFDGGAATPPSGAI